MWWNMSAQHQEVEDLTEWDLIYKRLTAISQSWAPHVSSEDIVSETILKFFTSETRLGWNPERSPLQVFLSGVCKNVARKHWRIALRQPASIDDTNDVAEHAKRFCVDPRDQYERKIVFLQLEQTLRKDTDPHLYELMMFVEFIDCEHNVNQQLAEHLGISPKQVVNIKKRLQRKLKAFLECPPSSTSSQTAQTGTQSVHSKVLVRTTTTAGR
jgi:RNA polymerase sigma factor (sigma-70 family)